MTLKNISGPAQSSRLLIIGGVVDGELVVWPGPVLDAVVAAARLLSHLDGGARGQLHIEADPSGPPVPRIRIAIGRRNSTIHQYGHVIGVASVTEATEGADMVPTILLGSESCIDQREVT